MHIQLLNDLHVEAHKFLFKLTVKFALFQGLKLGLFLPKFIDFTVCTF